VCKKLGVSEQTFYRWRLKYGALKEDEAQRLRALEQEDALLTDGGQLAVDDLVAQHCFLSAGRGRYFDEDFNELPGPVEPCGDWGLHGYRTLDDEVSDALGIPGAPV